MDKETKQIFELILNKIDGVDKRLDGMGKRLDGIEKRQDEMYIMQGASEENTKANSAEQNKMMDAILDIQGKVTKLTQEVDEHDKVISQIRAIK